MNTRRSTHMRGIRRITLVAVIATLTAAAFVPSNSGPVAAQQPLHATLALSSGDSIVHWASTQVGFTCAHYGWCDVAWCALFASKAWDEGGGEMPSLAAVSSIHTWAVANGRWRAGAGGSHHPGDLVLYQDGYGNWVHMGIVVDGTGVGGDIRTIEGNYASQVYLVPYESVYNLVYEPGFHIAGFVATVNA